MTTYAVVHSAQQYHVSTCILYVWPSAVSPLLPFRVRLQKEIAIAEQTVAENIQTNNELHQKLRCAHTHIHMYNSNLCNVTEVWGACIRPAESCNPHNLIPCTYRHVYMKSLWQKPLRSLQTKSHYHCPSVTHLAVLVCWCFLLHCGIKWCYC